MGSVLSLSGLVLVRGAQPIYHELGRGQAVAVLGPSGCGKHELIEVVLGRAQAHRGGVSITGSLGVAKQPGGRRLRPQAIAQRGATSDQAMGISEALTALGLWEQRQTSFDRLSPEQQIACELLEVLASKDDLIVIDGQLDVLDPWTLPQTLDLMRRRRAKGSAFLIVTDRPDVAAFCDELIVLRDHNPVFVGNRQALLQRDPVRLTIETNRSGLAESMVRPFALQIQEREGELHVDTASDQTLAAKLLVAGYGDVKATVLRPRSLAEALSQL